MIRASFGQGYPCPAQRSLVKLGLYIPLRWQPRTMELACAFDAGLLENGRGRRDGGPAIKARLWHPIGGVTD